MGPPRPVIQAKFVYAAELENGAIKVGVTSDILSRTQTLRSQFGEVKLIHIECVELEICSAVEAAAHFYLREGFIGRECFFVTRESAKRSILRAHAEVRRGFRCAHLSARTNHQPHNGATR